jgi:membrane associated rhomboid family serine protease
MKSGRLIPIIILLNSVVFFLWSYGGTENQEFMESNFAVSWEVLREGHWWVLLTAVFSHNLFFHLFINMFVLNSFGNAVEPVLGSKYFLIFYLIAGIFSSFTHALVSAFLLGQPDLPAVGASGAIAGVVLLFALFFPREKLLFFGILPLPAIWGALIFVGLDVWGLISQAEGGGLPIGHGAHLGGAFCGIVAYLYWRKRLRV